MQKYIKCPNCSITYKVNEFCNHLVECKDCGVVYDQSKQTVSMIDFVFNALKNCKG